MGLPFFTPAYIPGNRVRFYGGHPGLEAALRRQQDEPSFPVDFSYLQADIEFVHLEPGKTYDDRGHDGDGQAASAIRGIRTAIASNRTAASVVYSTDSEHKLADPAETETLRRFLPRPPTS